MTYGGVFQVSFQLALPSASVYLFRISYQLYDGFIPVQ